MNPTVKVAFVARLRSGMDAQTCGVLNRTRPGTTPGTDRPDEVHPAGLCCLGVLSEMAADAGVVNRVIDDANGRIGYTIPGWKIDDAEADDYVAYGVLHPKVQEWAGVSSVDPLIAVEGETTPMTMASLNDQLRLSLPAIADRVEAQL